MGKRLILTVGLPRSGKTTWAKTTGFPIISRDAIRLALHHRPYIQDSEEMVSALEIYMVKALFLAGHNTVIVDACHLKEEYIKRWQHGNWNLEKRTFPCTMQTCIKRAEADGRKDLIPIIKRMAHEQSFT